MKCGHPKACWVEFEYTVPHRAKVAHCAWCAEVEGYRHELEDQRTRWTGLLQDQTVAHEAEAKGLRERHEKQLRALVEKWRRQEREREIESARINQRLLAGETITVESKTSSCLNADLLACADELEAALAQTTSHNK
jgi:hypothetical protein